MDKVEWVAFVVYFVGVLVFIIFATFALIAGERSTWTVFALLLWQIAFTAFAPLYRRWKAQNRADESVDDEAGGASV